MSEESSPKKCPFSGLKCVIDWLSVVDEFKIKDHANFLPRWVFLILIMVLLSIF